MITAGAPDLSGLFGGIPSGFSSIARDYWLMKKV
jgi:hypothetical protein